MILTQDNHMVELDVDEQAIIRQLTLDVNEAIKRFKNHQVIMEILRRTRFVFILCASEIKQDNTHRQSYVQLAPDSTSLDRLNCAIRDMSVLLKDVELRAACNGATEMPTLQYEVVIVGPNPEVR